MWKCNQCRQENSDEYTFCYNCGTERQDVPSPENIESGCTYSGEVFEDADNISSGVSVRKKTSNRKVVLSVVGIVILLLAIILWISVLHKPADNPSSPAAALPSESIGPVSVPGHFHNPNPNQPIGPLEDHFTYSLGSRNLRLVFDPNTNDLLSVSSFEGEKCVFVYRFKYYADGRIDCITRYDGSGSEVVRRDYSYSNGNLIKECKSLPDGSFTVTDLVLDINYDDHTNLNGRPCEFVNWPVGGYQIEGYTLSIWDESRELWSEQPIDRPIFRMQFYFDGRADTYVYLWNDEIGVYSSEFRQAAEEQHCRETNGTWQHYRTDLTIMDQSGNYLGYAQRWGDDTEWEPYLN